MRKDAREQREAIEEIEKAGGDVFFDYQVDASGNPMPWGTPPGPRWLSKLLGEDPFVNVSSVLVPQISDAKLEPLERLTELRTLQLVGAEGHPRRVTTP